MKFFIAAAIVTIAFRVNEHYWLVELLGGYVITAFAPIAVIASAGVAYQLLGRASRPGGRVLRWAWLSLGLYAGTATLSLLVYEPTLDSLIQWLVYLWAPITIFVSLLWLPVLHADKMIFHCVKVLIGAGVVCAVYAMYSMASFDPGSAPPVLSTNQGEWSYFTTFDAGFRDTSTIRRTVPGLNTSNFAPMLLPLVFLALLMARQATGLGKAAYLGAAGVCSLTIVEALSRGAMIPLIVGVFYLAYVNWYPRFGRFLAVAGVAALLMAQPLMYARILMTIGSAIPLQDKIDRSAWNSQLLAPYMHAVFAREEHFLTNPYTVELILDKPLLGRGWTNFTEGQSVTLSHLSGKDHNNYLSVGAAFGLPALIAYAFFMIGLGIGLRKVIFGAAPGSAVWQAAHIWAAVLIGFALYLVGAPAEFHFVWLWFGLLGAWVRNQLLSKAVHV